MRLTSPGRQRERGVTLVLVALSLTVLFIIVALVIDYGFVQNTRQTGKTTTDAAVSAGVNSLAPDAVARPWRGVCEAYRYVQANEPDRTFTVTYLDGNETPVSGSPCSSLLTQQCLAGDPSSWAWLRATDGERVIDIRSGYTLPDPNFPEDAGSYAGDVGAPCDHLAVIAADVDPAYFGGIVGAVDYDTAIRSVGRIKIGSINTGVPAFLMLDRTDCEVLSQQVGASEGGIIVESSGAGTPGIIHVDSAGTPCIGASGNSPNAYVVYSSELGTGGSPRPGLRVDGATAATKGILSLYALAAGNTTNAWATAAGVSADIVSGAVISRTPVDEKYNPPSPGTPTIKNLHEATVTLANAASVPAGYTQVASGGGCNNLDGNITVPTSRAFVNCPGGVTIGATLTFTNATHVVFNGPVDIGNNRALFMPVATNVVVGGTSARGLTVANGGRLGLNSTSFTNDDASTRAACNAADGPASRISTLTVFGGGSSGGTEGAVNIGGRAAICKTAAYLAGPKSVGTHNAQQVVNGSGHPTCVAATPCPLTGASNVAQNAHLIVSGTVRWTAPNRLTSTTPPAGAVGTEDLALWTEAPQDSQIKSGGVLDAQGVFFLPNSYLLMRSPADFTPRDAQFIARKLKLLQGTLQMRPTAANNVQIPILESTSLVR